MSTDAPPATRSVTVTINGATRSAEVEPRMLLVWYIREALGLTGTHIGCDTTSCGACTVLVDGVPMKSCTMFAVQAEGCEITTVEGAQGPRRPPPGAGGIPRGARPAVRVLHPGDDADLVALLADNPNPSEEEIRWALSGQICRCTGYTNIVKAVQYAAKKLAEGGAS